MLDILVRCKKDLKRVDIRGNDFSEEDRQLYKESFKKEGISRVVLGLFESDDEDDDEEYK